MTTFDIEWWNKRAVSQTFHHMRSILCLMSLLFRHCCNFYFFIRCNIRNQKVLTLCNFYLDNLRKICYFFLHARDNKRQITVEYKESIQIAFSILFFCFYARWTSDKFDTISTKLWERKKGCLKKITRDIDMWSLLSCTK